MQKTTRKTHKKEGSGYDVQNEMFKAKLQELESHIRTDLSTKEVEEASKEIYTSASTVSYQKEATEEEERVSCYPSSDPHIEAIDNESSKEDKHRIPTLPPQSSDDIPRWAVDLKA
ncbi:hypothetical protein L1987_32635 [Smallanthus sonchifolius]|uniref:Uncharacterized protein n=1 Tax=Smallanthus sonchifolius TaxID=185202 RepID=A0ACB9HNA1_9ASTR|nr:hypothetical protein L1987_32635 [Smallanthus sonchifolius]